MLDGLNAGSLAAKEVVPHLLADDTALREQAVELFIARRDWATKASPALKRFLKHPKPELRETVRELLVNGIAEIPDSFTGFIKHSNADGLE